MKYLILLFSLVSLAFSNSVNEKIEDKTKPKKEKIEIKNDYQEKKTVPKVKNKSLKDLNIEVSGQVRYRYEF